MNWLETLKKKLDAHFRKYRILGACNPLFAYNGLQAEERIGLMLPCNIVVQETASGRVEVAAIDPVASMQMVDNPQLLQVTEQAQAKLKSVVDSL